LRGALSDGVARGLGRGRVGVVVRHGRAGRGLGATTTAARRGGGRVGRLEEQAAETGSGGRAVIRTGGGLGGDARRLLVLVRVGGEGVDGLVGDLGQRLGPGDRR